MAPQALFLGAVLDLSTVFTDHSLFGFADASAVVTNTFLKFSLANTDHCVCVSHTGKENTVLRSGVPRARVSVIPNAVDPDVFRPDYGRPDPAADDGAAGDGRRRVVVVIGSRLVYRKGIDLVVAIVPAICQKKYGSHEVTFSSDTIKPVQLCTDFFFKKKQTNLG